MPKNNFISSLNTLTKPTLYIYVQQRYNISGKIDALTLLYFLEGMFFGLFTFAQLHYSENNKYFCR